MLKKLIMGVLCITMMFMLTGCGNKTAITSSDFKDKMENKGYVVQDATNQFSEYNYINQVYIALNSDSACQIEFYELSNIDSAINFFNNNKTLFENSKTSGAVEASVDVGNNSKYTLETNGQYKVVSRIDNTVVYLNVSHDYKSEVKDILKELGY